MTAAATPQGKPNPADPLANPSPVPERELADLPPGSPNEPPPAEPDDTATPDHPLVPPDHPLGPHGTVEST